MTSMPSAERLLVPVAQYLRVSTEDQKYSTAVQAAAIEKYASANGFVVAKTFQDEARSGLSLSGRPGLQDLLATVSNHACGFTKVLVLDVSRWGRFQNTDESAYYDFHCRMHGVQVIYVAEPFINDASPFATAFKALKRAAAAEYSRELSIKVRAGQADLVRRGFRVASPVPYGMRKLVVNDRMEPRMLLKVGDRKGLQSHHNLLVLGPDEEVAVVKRIFKDYIHTDLSIRTIAAMLQSEGVLNHYGKQFTVLQVLGVLRQEAYVGRNVWGKRRWQLGNRSSKLVDKSEWFRQDGCFPAIISARTYAAARVKATRLGPIPLAAISVLLHDLAEGLERGVQYSNAELGVHTTFGTTPYQRAFGGITLAYALLGVDDEAQSNRFRQLRQTLELNLPARQHVIAEIQSLGYQTHLLRLSSGVVIERKLKIRVYTAHQQERGGDSWNLSTYACLDPADLVVVVRMAQHEVIRDYLVIPPTGRTTMPVWLNAKTLPRFHDYVEEDLTCLGFYVGSLLEAMPSVLA